LNSTLPAHAFTVPSLSHPPIRSIHSLLDLPLLYAPAVNVSGGAFVFLSHVLDGGSNRISSR